MPQKDTQVKKITLIGICNGIAAQFTDEHGNLNVDVPIKIIETRQVDGQSLEEPDWVRVTARGNTAQKLAAVRRIQCSSGRRPLRQVPNATGIAAFYIGVSAYSRCRSAQGPT